MAQHVRNFQSSSSQFTSRPEYRPVAPRACAVVVIDSDPRMQRYLQLVLRDRNREVMTFGSSLEALNSLQDALRPSLIIASSSLPDMPVLELLARVRSLNPHCRVVLMAHIWEYPHLQGALREGARDLLLKPFRTEQLLRLLHDLEAEEAAGVACPLTEIPMGNGCSFVLASPAMRALQQQAARVAAVNMPVLILGESGTGKEVLARYIHSLSPQSERMFLKVNCAAVPSELLESELFGYEPGAFTGATRSKPGKFRQCHNGTMFLDEIGEMHPNLQAKLLQVLQDGTFSPLGSRTTEKVNVRILAATNIDMKAAIVRKMFREDLYYRLNGLCLQLPPLRERREEVPVLLDYFLQRYAHDLNLPAQAAVISSRLRRACIHYDWPGNLRELETFVKRYLVLHDEDLLLRELQPEPVGARFPAEPITAESLGQALRDSGGHRRKAAAALGISYKALLGRMRQLGLDSGPRIATA